MKNIKIIIVLLSVFILTHCASVPSEEKSPFLITKATYKESAKEIEVSINYNSEVAVDFVDLFIKNYTINITKKGNNSLFGKVNKLKKIDLQLHADPKKEFGNTSNKLKNKVPFNLKDDNAVISYKDNGIIKYVEIKNIEKE